MIYIEVKWFFYPKANLKVSLKCLYCFLNQFFSGSIVYKLSNLYASNALCLFNLQHLGWCGEGSALSPHDTANKARTLPPLPCTTEVRESYHIPKHNAISNGTLMVSINSQEENNDGDTIGIYSHRYETLDCVALSLDGTKINGTGGDDGKGDNQAVATSHVLVKGTPQERDTSVKCNDTPSRELGKLEESVTVHAAEKQEMTQNVVVRQTVVQMEPVVKQVLRRERRAVEIRQQTTRSAAAKIRTRAPSLSQFERRRIEAEEEEYDRFKNFRYIDDFGTKGNKHGRCG